MRLWGAPRMIIAVISALISSIALVGVVASLLLQARQLRASQLQASRSTQFDLVKLLLDRPELAETILGDASPNDMIVNSYLKYFELSYLMRVASRESVQHQLTGLFTASYPREWWATHRETYKIEAESAGKLELDFFTISDEAFRRATQQVAPDAPAETKESGSLSTG